MKKNLLKAIIILVVLVGGLNIKWMVALEFGTHFSLLESLNMDISEKQFLTPESIKESLNYYVDHKFTTTCDIVENYDNVVVVEYRGNDYKVNVKDGDSYNNASKAKITFKTSDTLKDYQIVNIQPQ